VSLPRPTPKQNSELRIRNPSLYREMDETTSINYIIIIILVPLLLENDGLGLLSAHGLWFNGWPSTASQCGLAGVPSSFIFAGGISKASWYRGPLSRSLIDLLRFGILGSSFFFSPECLARSSSMSARCLARRPRTMKKIATPIAMTAARATATPMPALAPEVSFRRVRCFDVRFARCMREDIVDVVDGGESLWEGLKIGRKSRAGRDWREWRKWKARRGGTWASECREKNQR
jgi:hypothetical protein